MLLAPYDSLPKNIQNEKVKEYYNNLKEKKSALIFKRVFDIIISSCAIILLSWIMLLTALLIKLSSKGPVFYKQMRVGRYNRDFRILKFRTMVEDADKKGPHITVLNDNRITAFGKIIRKFRMDEFPQLFNILMGDMSLLGTRPEVRMYVDHYSDEMLATLLLPPGMFGTSSYRFRDEAKMLSGAENAETIYIDKILPVKMSINLEYTKNLSIKNEFKTLFEGIICIFQKDD